LLFLSLQLHSSQLSTLKCIYLFDFKLLQLSYCRISGCAPSQIHLSFGDDYYTSKELSSLRLPSANVNDNQAYLVFHTKDICNLTLNITNATNSSQVVYFQKITLQNNFNYTFQTESKNVSYQSIAYTALINNLTYGSSYKYTIQDSQNASLITPINFRLASPRISNTTYATNETYGNLTNKTISNKIVLIGNLDNNIRGSLTINHVYTQVNKAIDTYAGIIQIGDIAYNLETNNGATGDTFFESIQQLSSNIPFVITSGNKSRYANYSFFDLRVRNPLFNQTQNRYFSYNLQGIHFVNIDFDFYENSTKEVQNKILKWIQTDLETANDAAHRAIWPFTVVVSSQSIYCIGNISDNSSCANLYSKRKVWDELFSKTKINLVISAGSSSYQRLSQIYQNVSSNAQVTNETSNQTAPLYINEGIGGVGTSNPTEYKSSGYARVLALNPGYGELYILNSTEDIRLVYNHFDSQAGSLRDSIQIVQTLQSGSKKNILSNIGSFLKFLLVIGIILAAIQAFRIHKKRKQDPERVRLTNMKEMSASRSYNGKHAANISMVDLVL